MKIQKRMVALGLTGIMTTMLISGASAINGIIGERRPSSIVAIREDVPLSEAMRDLTFDLEKSRMFSEDRHETRAAKWNVWGETMRATSTTSYPIGYSEHVRDGKVLNTWHYTRTYLSNTWGLRKVGDSGYYWGNGTVSATGEACLDELFVQMTHYVKYGTESKD